MRYYFDENFPPQIAKALQIAQGPLNEKIEIFNVSDIYGRGAADETWIPDIAKNKGIVITQDLNIHRQRQQRELYEKHKMGIIFLKPPSKTGLKYWEMVEKMFAVWAVIKSNTKNAKKPFAFVIRARSKKMLPL